jgi:hypothetical protein
MHRVFCIPDKIHKNAMREAEMHSAMTQQYTIAAADIAAKCLGIATGGGYLVRCPCPGQSDRNPSLFIKDGQRLLVRCYVGCDPADVLDALNVRAPDPVDDWPVREGANRLDPKPEQVRQIS